MSELSIIIFEEGFDRGIRYRFVSDWFKVDSYVSSKERIISEIERKRPDVVALDLDLYGRIDGTEISRLIRNRFKTLVMYA
jgi:DNA-binding response OmpR family regulator